MSSKNQGYVHTVPNGNGWSNKQDGKVVSNHNNKENAVAAGRREAKHDGTEHVIHNRNGQISERNSYGNDPKKSKG